MRHIFTVSNQNHWPKRTFKLMVRQGLTPVDDANINMAARFAGSNSGRYGIKASPDQSKGVYFQDASSTNFTYWFNISDTGWTTDTNTVAAFSGVVNDCFTSNDYYGFVGGSSSFINVFRWSNHSLVTVDKTGLGTVYRCSIHANGYSLAVSHSTAPYIRVYDLRDGTYIQPLTAQQPAGASNLLSWTGNGNWLFVSSISSPYVMKYDPALTTRTTLSTTNIYHVESLPSGYNQQTGMYSIPHPTKPDCAIMCTTYNSTGATQVLLYEANGSTNALTTIQLAGNDYYGCVGFCADAVAGVLYAAFSTTSSISNPPNAGYTHFRAYDLSTYAVLPALSGAIVNGTSTESRPMMIINKNYGQITGTVRDVNNNPVARQVRVFRRSDGLLVGQTTSNATTGDYSVFTPDATSEGYDVQFYTAGGELLNDLVYARVTPALIP